MTHTTPHLAKRLTPCGLALLSMLVYYASLPPIGLKYLVFAAPALWTVLVKRTRDENAFDDAPKTPKSLFLLKWLARGEYRQYWFAAFLFWLATLWWVGYPHPAVRFGWLALAAYLAIYLPIFVFETRVLKNVAKIPIPIAATIAWTSCEAFRNVVMGGFSFAGLSHALYDVPIFLQLAEIGGEYLVGAWIALVGSALGVAYLAGRREPTAKGKATRIASVAIIILLANGIFGKSRLDALDELEAEMKNHSGRPLRVALLQDATQYRYPIPRELNHAVSDRYMSLAIETLQRDEPVDLIVWPEGTFYGGAYDVFFDFPRNYGPLYDYFNESNARDGQEEDGDEEESEAARDDLATVPPSEELKNEFREYFEAPSRFEARKNLLLARDALRRQRRELPALADRLQANVLLGYATVEPMLDGTVTYYNSAIYVPQPADVRDVLQNSNEVGGHSPVDEIVNDDPNAFRRYDKVDLVMFGEYVPFVQYFPKSWNIQSICAKFTLARGRGPTDVAVRTRDGDVFRLSPHICFESSIPHYVLNQTAQLKAHGSDPDALVCVSNDGWFRCGAEIDLHLATQVFRAIENRRSLLAATHGGFSAWIDAAGRIREKGARGETQVVYADAYCVKTRPLGLIRAQSGDVNLSIVVRNTGFAVLPLAVLLALGAALRRKRATKRIDTPASHTLEN